MGLKKSETSDNKYLPDFQNCNSTGTNPELQKSPWKKAAQEKNYHIRKKTAVELEILPGVFVVNTNR